MNWIEQLPLFIRFAPAAVCLLCLVWCVVFLQTHQVDGERQLFALFVDHFLSIVVFFEMAMLFILPSFVLLFVVGATFLGLKHFNERVTQMIRSRVDVDTSYL